MAGRRATQKKIRRQQCSQRKARRALRCRPKRAGGDSRRNSGLHLAIAAAMDRPEPVTPPAVVGRKIVVEVPERLNFGDQIEDTLGFFAQLDAAFAARKVKAVVVDHRGLLELQPDAALVLIATFYRAHQEFPRCRKLCHFPKDPTIRAILRDIGYFRYFPETSSPTKNTQPATRYYLQHFHDQLTRGGIVKVLLAHFEQVINFTARDRSVLYGALIECMNNVAEHAYPLRRRYQGSYKEWWLLGYFDVAAREICFCFYDQGVGIPRTIRKRLKDFIRTGSSLIELAVERGHSSTKLATRGRGLPSLKKFVDTSHEGTLAIVSSRSRCIFPKAAGARKSESRLALRGTLVTWNICAPHQP